MPSTGRDKPVMPRIAVIVSRYNPSVTDRLREGALRVVRERLGADAADVYTAPGAFELPALALAAADCGRYAGVVALGCLISGETRHDRYIAAAVAHGLVEVTLQSGVPAAFGVITAATAAQARARAGGDKGNKGEEAATAVLDAAEAINAIHLGRPDAGSRRTAPDKAAAPGARDTKPRRVRGSPTVGGRR